MSQSQSHTVRDKLVEMRLHCALKSINSTEYIVCYPCNCTNINKQALLCYEKCVITQIMLLKNRAFCAEYKNTICTRIHMSYIFLICFKWEIFICFTPKNRRQHQRRSQQKIELSRTVQNVCSCIWYAIYRTADTHSINIDRNRYTKTSDYFLFSFFLSLSPSWNTLSHPVLPFIADQYTYCIIARTLPMREISRIFFGYAFLSMYGIPFHFFCTRQTIEHFFHIGVASTWIRRYKFDYELFHRWTPELGSIKFDFHSTHAWIMNSNENEIEFDFEFNEK